MIVYKYLHPDRTDVLARSRIRFAPPALLNDPFEARPRMTEYRKTLRNAMLSTPQFAIMRKLEPNAEARLDQIVDEVLERVPEMMGEGFLILCLTRRRDNPTMWAHYADQHQGFVVGFDSDSPFFAPGNGKAVAGLREVRYADERAVIPENGLGGLSNDEMRAANLGMFFTKGPQWAYEEEMRILAHPHYADERVTIADGHDICLYAFPPEMVQEVIIGHRTSDAKRREIANLRNSRYPTADLLLARPSDTAFALDVVPYRA